MLDNLTINDLPEGVVDDHFIFIPPYIILVIV